MTTPRERAEATAALTYSSGSVLWGGLAANIEAAITEHVRALQGKIDRLEIDLAREKQRIERLGAPLADALRIVRAHHLEHYLDAALHRKALGE
jgi:hypothetical protein